MKFNLKFLLIVFSFVMVLSIPLSIFGQGKALANENEEEEEIVRAFTELDFIYDKSGNFLGVYEEDLEILKDTEYEYVIDELDEQGYLLRENEAGFGTANVQDEVRQNALDAFENDSGFREAFTSCLNQNFGPAVGEAFAQQVIQGRYVLAISTLGNLGLRATIPGLAATYVQCAIEAEL